VRGKLCRPTLPLDDPVSARRGTDVKHEPETVIAISHSRIRQLLESPNVSDWLKAALRAADGHDPVKLQNEIEILRHVIAPMARTDPEVAMRPIIIKQPPE
jgi:hypothetical protein